MSSPPSGPPVFPFPGTTADSAVVPTGTALASTGGRGVAAPGPHVVYQQPLVPLEHAFQLQALNAQLRDENERLRSEVRRVREEHGRTLVNAQGLHEQVQSLAARNVDLDDAVARLQEDNARLHAENEELRATIQDLTGRVGQLEAAANAQAALIQAAEYLTRLAEAYYFFKLDSEEADPLVSMAESLHGVLNDLKWYRAQRRRGRAINQRMQKRQDAYVAFMDEFDLGEDALHAFASIKGARNNFAHGGDRDTHPSDDDVREYLRAVQGGDTLVASVVKVTAYLAGFNEQ